MGAHKMPRTFGRDQQNIEIGTRLDLRKENVKSVRETDRGAFFGVRGDMLAVDFRLQFVGQQQHQ